MNQIDTAWWVQPDHSFSGEKRLGPALLSEYQTGKACWVGHCVCGQIKELDFSMGFVLVFWLEIRRLQNCREREQISSERES